MSDWITRRVEMEQEWLGVPDTEQVAILGGSEMETELSVLDELLLSAPGAACPEDSENELEMERLVVGSVGLRELGVFTRWYIDHVRASGKKLDCADLAIEVWIMFASHYRLPISFTVSDWRRSQRRQVNQDTFSSTESFVRYVQGNVSAQGLIGCTYDVPGGHRQACSGDVYLWQYFNDHTGRPHRYGHAQLVYRVTRSPVGPGNDRIQIVQGNLPPRVPQFRDYSAGHFNRSFTVHLTTDRGREPHMAELVGDGPRRFLGFRHLA